MQNSLRSVVVVALVAQAGLLASTASAGLTFTSSTTSVPTYSNVLNFDSAPIPAGVPGYVSQNAYASLGVSYLDGNDGAAFVAPVGTYISGSGITGGGNQASSSSYLILNFSSNLTALSLQFWGNSTTATFSGGGATIDFYNGGTYINSIVINNPHWGSDTTATWFNAVATGATTFNHVEISGHNSIFASDVVVIDNISWAPTPGAAAALGLGGLMTLRRRR